MENTALKFFRREFNTVMSFSFLNFGHHMTSYVSNGTWGEMGMTISPGECMFPRTSKCA